MELEMTRRAQHLRNSVLEPLRLLTNYAMDPHNWVVPAVGRARWLAPATGHAHARVLNQAWWCDNICLGSAVTNLKPVSAIGCTSPARGGDLYAAGH